MESFFKAMCFYRARGQSRRGHTKEAAGGLRIIQVFLQTDQKDARGEREDEGLGTIENRS